MNNLLRFRIRFIAFSSSCLAASLALAGAPRGNLPSPSSTIRSSQPAKQSPASTWLPSWGNKTDATGATKPTTTAKTPGTGKSDFDGRDISGEISRAKNYERVGEFLKARKIYEDLRLNYPNHPEPAYRLGVVADQQRKHLEAEKLFKFAVQTEPQNAEYIGALGYCYFLQGRFREAETTLSQAARIAPKNVRVRNNLALAMGHQGKYSEALQQFGAGGSESEAYFNLAFVYASQEKAAEAKECFRKSLTLDPTNQKAREALSSFNKFESLPKYMQEAEEYYDERGVKWVPYNENAPKNDSVPATTTGEVRQASAESNINSRDSGSRRGGAQPTMRGAPNPILRNLK